MYPPKRNTMQITSNHCLLFPTEASDKRYNISKIVKMSSWLMSIDVDWCWLMLFGYYVNAQSTLINYIYIYINDYHILSKNIKEVYYLVITSHGSFNVNNLFAPPGGSFADLMYGDFFDRNEKPCRRGCADCKEDDIGWFFISNHGNYILIINDNS